MPNQNPEIKPPLGVVQKLLGQDEVGRGYKSLFCPSRGTLPVKMFGPFWSVCKNGPSRSRWVTPMMMPRPCPSSSRLLKPFFKSHNFFIMEECLVSEIF